LRRGALIDTEKKEPFSHSPLLTFQYPLPTTNPLWGGSPYPHYATNLPLPTPPSFEKEGGVSRGDLQFKKLKFLNLQFKKLKFLNLQF
jgi:hypothetical protein